MAPTTRSSAPSTPSTGTTSGLNALPDSPSSTPRKVPRCAQCNRERKGHPRQGCPYAKSPSPTAAKAEERITEALGSMHIDLEGAEERIPERRPRRSSVKPPAFAEASLASISTDANEVLNRLLQPGIMNDEIGDDERRVNVERWQNLVTPSKATKAKPRMPGTLITPSTTKSSVGAGELSSFMVGNRPPSQVKVEETKPRARISSALQPAPTLAVEEDFTDLVATQQAISSSHFSSSSTGSQPLARSMSVEERHTFLNNLAATSQAPPATVFVLPIAEIPAEQQSAMKLGFYCRSVVLMNGLGWLIIGMDQQAVEGLFASVQGTAKGISGGALRAAAGGAVAGAVATWTGLAFI